MLTGLQLMTGKNRLGVKWLTLPKEIGFTFGRDGL